MRILVLVLLLAASPIPSWAQDADWRPAPSALPASLTPAAGWNARDPIVLDLRANHKKGAVIGAVVGFVAGGLVAHYHVCNVESGGEGGADLICRVAGLGLGTLAGALVGGAVSLITESPEPDEPPSQGTGETNGSRDETPG